MNSRIYIGEVRHRRLEPVGHAFTYPFYFYGLDLAELEQLDRDLPLFGYNRRSLVSIHDSDYLDGHDQSVEARIRDWLLAAGIGEPLSNIVLITSARYFNYVFNPVSFYLCYGEDDELRCVVAEVNNTFGDRHLYLVPQLEGQDGAYRAATLHQKQFHVSPFNDMKGEYEFSFAASAGQLEIRVNLVRNGQTVFGSTLAGRGVPLTSRNLTRSLLRFPFAALMTMPRILKQAIVLKLKKKLPVFTRPEPQSERTIIRRTPGLFERWAQRLILRLLARIRHGALTVVLPDGTRKNLGAPDAQPAHELHVKRHRFFTRMLRSGEIGFGEAFVEGDFECDDLPGLIELLGRNRDLFPSENFLLAKLGIFRATIAHALRRNTRAMSQRNIHAHYDLSNQFFRTFLDPTMTYSCGLFHRSGESLEQAQRNKLQALIEKARISTDMHVLEIGSGWGSFAIEAARSTGCRVTSVTISKEQRALATERVRAAGLDDRVDIRLCDYRDIDGTFDRIVSIEMLEAVGHAYLGDFFRQCDALLKPNGLAVLQVITYPDQGYDAYRRSSDWVRKHIFPGGHLPSLTALTRSITRHSSLVVQDVDNIGPHYARTLHAWRRRFLHNIDQISELGLDEAFRRKWLYYLSYCEAGFAMRYLNTLQVVLARPGTVLDEADHSHVRPDPVAAQPPTAPMVPEEPFAIVTT